MTKPWLTVADMKLMQARMAFDESPAAADLERRIRRSVTRWQRKRREKSRGSKRR